jgi:hypothetical protein
VRELVAEGVRYVLDDEPADPPAPPSLGAASWRPAWFGMLRPWAALAATHDMEAVRESIACGRQ